MRNILKKHCAAVLCAALLGFCACRQEPQTRSSFALDTLCTVTLYEPARADWAEESLELLAREEIRLSAHLPQSEVSRINEAGGRPVRVSKETAALVAAGVAYAQATDGLFDISIGPVSALWDFHSDGKAVPDASALERARQYVNGSAIIVNEAEATVRLPSKEARMDLGGIAKGWISDVMADALRNKGVKSAIINLGGNVVAIGSRPDGKPFAIGVQAPFAARNEIIGTVQVRDACVVTAGIYERGFEVDGRLYHHILDPRTGYPADTGVIAATVVAKRGVDGDALSTSCLLLGEEKALLLLKQKQAEAVLVREDGSLVVTDGLKDVFTPIEK